MKQPVPLNTSLNSLCIGFVRAALAFISASFNVPAMNYFIFVTESPFRFLFVQDISSMFCSLLSCMCVLGCVVLYFTLRMPSISMSGIPKNGRLPPSIIKNLKNLFSCLIVTLCTSDCFMLAWLYVCNMAHFSDCFANCFIAPLGNNVLNIFKGIGLPALPVSSLNLNFALCLLPVFNLILMLDLTLVQLRDFIFTMSVFVFHPL